MSLVQLQEYSISSYQRIQANGLFYFLVLSSSCFNDFRIVDCYSTYAAKENRNSHIRHLPVMRQTVESKKIIIKIPPPGGSPEGDRRKIQGKDVYQFIVAHPERNVK